MRIFQLFVCFGIISFSAFSQDSSLVKSESEILERLKEIPEVHDIVVIPEFSYYRECYEFFYDQPLNHKDSTSKIFPQKVRLFHYIDETTVTFHLEGYELGDPYLAEPSLLFFANQIEIEHRFFADSKPDGNISWEELTIENAANDHHRIIASIREYVYPSQPFISFGASKGGICTLVHRSFFPEDVTASICYVAPLMQTPDFKVVDVYLEENRPEKANEKIREFQMDLLQRKEEVLPIFEFLIDHYEYILPFPIEESFLYYVFEFYYVFWQYGEFKPGKIPGQNKPTYKKLEFLFNVVDLGLITCEKNDKLAPYYWAAASELGAITYDLSRYWEHIPSTYLYAIEPFLPIGIIPSYNPEPISNVLKFIENEAKNIVFIYGQADPWSAGKVQLPKNANEHGLYSYTFEGGSHNTDILNFKKKTRMEILAILKGWTHFPIIRKY